MAGYNLGYKYSKYVQKALDEGYTITEKGLLCWANMPPDHRALHLRLLFTAMEGTLTFKFWAMHKRTTGVPVKYGMTSFCPWVVADLPYTGLCSHAAFNKRTEGMEFLTLTEEETKLITAAQRAKKCEHKNGITADWTGILKMHVESSQERIFRHPGSILARNVQRHFSHHYRLRSISQSVGSQGARSQDIALSASICSPGV